MQNSNQCTGVCTVNINYTGMILWCFHLMSDASKENTKKSLRSPGPPDWKLRAFHPGNLHLAAIELANWGKSILGLFVSFLDQSIMLHSIKSAPLVPHQLAPEAPRCKLTSFKLRLLLDMTLGLNTTSKPTAEFDCWCCYSYISVT